jgi:hypothetical protein
MSEILEETEPTTEDLDRILDESLKKPGEINELIPAEPLPLERVQERVQIVQDVMRRAMKEDVHYGKIPGCGPKPTLLKPGAEMLGTLFQWGHRYKVHHEKLDSEGNVVFFATCTIFSQRTGQDVDSGEGACTTFEGKYAKQCGPRTDRHGKEYLVTPHEFYNTCLKMACKRALVAATINATGVSSIFTQDLEDMPHLADEAAPRQPLTATPAKRPYKIKPSPVEAQPATVQGMVRGEYGVSRSWSNDYEGKTYFFAKLENGWKVQTKDAALGAILCGYGGGDRAYLVLKPSPKPGKYYLESIEKEDLPE